MKKEEIKVVKDWNMFVETLQLARDLWDRMHTSLDTDPVDLENLPYKVQKYLSMFKRMQFSLAIPELVLHWRAYGGLDEMSVEVPLETPKEEINKLEEVEDGRRRENISGRSGWRFRRSDNYDWRQEIYVN